jgi:hypothetical protein
VTRSTIFAAVLAVTIAPASVAAQEESGEPAKPEKKICRTEKMTGSLTRRTRICLTEAQWREVNSRTRKGVDEMVSGASGAPKCISPSDVACTGT